MFGQPNQPYQPSQLYHFNQDGVTCELIQPDQSLVTDIYYYWKLSITQPNVSLPIIPDGALDLVLSPQIPDFAALYLPKTEHFELTLHGPIEYVGICFRTEKSTKFFPFTLDKLSALEDGSPTVSTLNLQNLVRDVQGVSDTSALRSLFDQFLLKPGADSDPGKMKMWSTVFDSLEVGAVETMASQLRISERQLRRVSQGLLGLSPKQIQRIVRLQNALTELLHPEDTLQTADYYDDSHRIKELKTLTGLTPGEIRKMAENYNQK